MCLFFALKLCPFILRRLNEFSDHFSLFVEMALPLPLGTALSQPLLPATSSSSSSELAHSQTSSFSTGSNLLPNSSANVYRNLMVSNSTNQERSSTTTNTMQSIIGLAPGQLQNPTSTTNHHNLSTNTNNPLSVGGNPNSLVVGGRSSTNHMAGNHI